MNMWNETHTQSDLQRSPLRAVEDAVEQNDNSFDGIINNLPPTPEEHRSVLEELKARQAETAVAAEPGSGRLRSRTPHEKEDPERS